MSIRTNSRNIVKKVLKVFVIAVLVICTLLPAEPVCAAKKLSKKEIRKYTQILETRQFVEDSHGLIYDDVDNGTFFLRDINGDGRKELIVCGVLGLRHVCGTVIYSYDGSHFHRCTKQGDSSLASGKGIKLEDNDYELTEDDQIFFSTDTVYKLNAAGRLKARLESYEKSTLHSRGNIKYYKYNSSGKKTKISKSEYDKLYKKFKLKKIKAYAVNRENIEKYVK